MKTKTETLSNWEYLAIERALENILEREPDDAEHARLETLCRKVRLGDKFKLVSSS